MANEKQTNKRVIFSIIIPVYNVENYLRKCLDSIVNQSFSDFEVIIINDGSTDNSYNICKEYEELYDNIYLFNQPNMGLISARRKGISLSNGQYLVHVDSDDFVDKDLLKELYGCITESESDLVIYNYRFVSDGDEIIKNHQALFPADKPYVVIEKRAAFQKMVDSAEVNNIWIKCAKREIVDIDHDYSEYRNIKMGEDTLQSLPLLYNSNKICYLDRCLYSYRINPSGMSRRITRNYVIDFLRVRGVMYSYLKQDQELSGLMKSFVKMYYYKYFGYFLRIIDEFDDAESYNRFREMTKPFELTIEVKYKSIIGVMMYAISYNYHLLKLIKILNGIKK